MTPLLDKDKRLVAYIDDEVAVECARYRHWQATRGHDRPVEYAFREEVDPYDLHKPLDPRETFSILRLLYWEMPFYYKGQMTSVTPIFTVDEPHKNLPDWFWRHRDVIDVRHAAPIRLAPGRTF